MVALTKTTRINKKEKRERKKEVAIKKVRKSTPKLRSQGEENSTPRTTSATTVIRGLMKATIKFYVTLHFCECQKSP